MGEILLRAENIDKHFGITHALDNVSFTFNKGEIHALIGENGSGKSTLTSCLTGIYQKDSGKFILEGKEITATNQVEANHQGVAIIVQEIGTLSGLTVAENIFLGNEDQFTKCGIKNTAAMNKKAQEYLDSYGFNYIDATKVIDDYNFEDRKLVEIVKSTYFNPKVLVVDETTTALGQKGREELFKVMHKVRDTGNCVIFISHDLEEVIEQSDNISVLRDGVKIGSITKEEATPDRLKALMVGREIGDSYYRTDYGEKVSDEVVLSAKNVTVKGQIENLNLDLHKGEILGIGGLSECGMHEVGKALFGASYFLGNGLTSRPRIVTPDPANGNAPVKDPNYNYQRYSDYFVEDGSYLKLKNITLGYTFPKRWTRKAKIDRIRVYVSASNLLTFTDFSGLDPEFSTTTKTAYGIYYGSTYPQTRMISFGLDMNF